MGSSGLKWRLFKTGPVDQQDFFSVFFFLLN